MIKKQFMFCVLFLCVFYVNQGNAHFGVKYEPTDGRVIHGLGQYIPFYYSDSENWQYVAEYQNGINQVPVIYSVYAALDAYLNSLDSSNFIDMVSNHGHPYILLIGLVLFDSTYLTTGYNVNIPVQDILSGALDHRIIDIAQRLKAVNAPVYFRPGFEFGINNAGFHEDPDVKSSDFVNIWIYIYNVFTQQNVTNVAWVWNTVNPQSFNYMEWYPGNAYVDWWGINYYTIGQINNGDNFLNDADFHQKPVIVCESAPIQNGGTTNSYNWNNWFVPHFNKIRNNTHIKAFIYISDPWDRGQFASWADSRITNNETIRNNYENEMNDSIFIHMDEYINNPLIINDTLPLSPVMDFTATSGDEQIVLEWVNPMDPGFDGVRILRKTQFYPQTPTDGIIIYTGTDTSFTDLNLQNDTTYYYAAFCFDLVLNFSDPALASGTPQRSLGINSSQRLFKNNTLIFKISPNPFNSRTTFSFNLPKSGGLVELNIYNVTGQKVAILINCREAAGKKQLSWDANDLPSGIYYATLSVIGKQSQIINYKIIKILLIK